MPPSPKHNHHPTPPATAPTDRMRKNLINAMAFWNLSITGIWLHYVSLGGDLTEYELDAYMHGAYDLSAHQHDLLALSMNELIKMVPQPPRAQLSSEPDLDRVEPMAPDDF